MKEHSDALKDCARAASFGGCAEAHNTGELYTVIRSDRDPSRMFRVAFDVTPPRGYSFMPDAHDPSGKLKPQFWTLKRWTPGEKVAVVDEKAAHLARSIREATTVAECVDLARTLGFDYCAPPDIDGDPIAVRANLRDEVSAFLERSPMHANAGHLRDLHRRLRRMIADDPLMQAPTTPPKRKGLDLDALAVKTTAFATQPFTLTETEKGSRVYHGVALGEEFTVTLVDGKPPRAHLLGATARLVTEIGVQLSDAELIARSIYLPRTIVCTLTVKLRHMTPRDVADLAVLRAHPSQLLKLLAREMETDLHALALAPTERETEAINAAGMMTVEQAERILAMQAARHGADFNQLWLGKWEPELDGGEHTHDAAHYAVRYSTGAEAQREAAERLAAHRHTAQAMKDAKAGALRTEHEPGSRILLDSINVACSYVSCGAQPDQPCKGTRPNRFHNERIRAAYEANQPLLRKLAEQDEAKPRFGRYELDVQARGFEQPLIVEGRLTEAGRGMLATLQRAAVHDDPLADTTAQQLRRLAEEIERGDVGVRQVVKDVDTRGHFTVKLDCWEREGGKERAKRDEPRKLPEFTKERAPITPGVFAFHVVNTLEKRGLLPEDNPPSRTRQAVADAIAMHFELATMFEVERRVIDAPGEVRFVEAAPLSPAQFAEQVQRALDASQVWTHTPRGRGQAREGFWRLNAVLFREMVAGLFKAATTPLMWATAPDVMNDLKTYRYPSSPAAIAEAVYRERFPDGNAVCMSCEDAMQLIADGITRALVRSTVVGVDWGKAGEPSVTVYECGTDGQLTKTSAIMLPAVAAALPSVLKPTMNQTAVAAFDFDQVVQDTVKATVTYADGLGLYDALTDVLTISPREVARRVREAMHKVPQGRGALFPRGSLQCNVTAEELPTEHSVVLQVESTRGMGFRHRVDMRDTPQQQMFELVEFVFNHEMEPDEQSAMLHGGASVIFVVGKVNAQRSAAPFNAQSMIDLQVAAAEVVSGQLDKFWSTGGRMRTHENNQLAKMFETARASILALDPDRYQVKEAE